MRHTPHELHELSKVELEETARNLLVRAVKSRSKVDLVKAIVKAEATVETVRFPLRVISIHDGDTLTADVLLPWGITLRNEKIRESTYDAWEIRRGRETVIITDDELKKGKAALLDLQELFKAKLPFISAPTNAGRDKYGRLLAKYWALDPVKKTWTDVREFMVKRGHIRSNPET